MCFVRVQRGSFGSLRQVQRQFETNTSALLAKNYVKFDKDIGFYRLSRFLKQNTTGLWAQEALFKANSTGLWASRGS